MEDAKTMETIMLQLDLTGIVGIGITGEAILEVAGIQVVGLDGVGLTITETLIDLEVVIVLEEEGHQEDLDSHKEMVHQVMVGFLVGVEGSIALGP